MILIGFNEILKIFIFGIYVSVDSSFLNLLSSSNPLGPRIEWFINTGKMGVKNFWRPL